MIPKMPTDMSTGMKFATLIILLTFLYIFAATFLEMTKAGVELAKIVVPFLLGTGVGTIISFYFGKKREKEK